MMATFRSFPSHLKPMRGEGLITCAFSGFLRFPKDIIMIDGKPVAKDKADLYGAFGPRSAATRALCASAGRMWRSPRPS